MPTHHHRDGTTFQYDNDTKYQGFRHYSGMALTSEHLGMGFFMSRFGLHHESAYLLNGWSRVAKEGA